MPELEPLIAGWRTKLDRTLGDAEKIRELEAHLRDHIEALVRAGMPAATAFEHAARRLGEPTALAREFRRARPRWRPESAFEWILILLAMAVALVTCILVSGLVAAKLRLLLAVHVFAVMMGYLGVFATGLMGACALIVAWRRPWQEHERHSWHRALLRLTWLSTACVFVGIVLGMIWAAQNLGRAWSWSDVETGAAFVLLSSVLLLVAQSRRMPDRARYVVAVIGAVSLAAGWGRANAVTGGVPIVYLCGAFAIAQIAVLLLRSSAARDPATE